MQSNAKDKILRRRDDDTSDSDSSVPEMSCDPCGLEFPSMKAYVAHINGKKHSKKVAREKLVAKLLKEGNEKDETKDVDDDDDSSELHCDVCDKSFSGHVSYMTHLKSNVHAKYVKKQKLKEKMANMPEVLDKNEGEAEYGIIPKPYARCTTCQKEFSGPEPFAAHMKSSIHKKKVEMSKLDISKHQESKISDEESEVFAKCNACQKSFSGPIPYHTHMLSNIHKKSLEKMKVAEEMKKICEEYNPESGFICKVCKKAFTDPIMFKNHLANNSHEKQKAKEALKEFLSKFPEITFVAPFGYYDNQDDKSDSDDSDQEFYLICKICEMSFSGPESAQDHVKSKKHVKNKKDKLLLKLINDQKKGVNKAEKNISDFSADRKVKTDSSAEKIKNGDLSGKIKTSDSRGKNKTGVSSHTDGTTVLKENEADDFEHI